MMPQQIFTEVFQLIQAAKDKSFKQVNANLISLYWEIGKLLHQKIKEEAWGKGILNNISKYLLEKDPNLKGFNPRNLRRMKQFYLNYEDFSIWSPVVTKLSWTNNLIILSKTKSVEEKEFYLRLAIKERLSKRELERQIDSAVFERTVLADSKKPLSLKKLPQNTDGIFKDTYLFEFLNLPKIHSELDLKNALLQNLKKFILELGRDFTLLGEEYRIQVGLKDFYLDLLFYHRELQCLVVIELKIEDFKPEFLGKLNFYLEALDRDYKKPHENPSIGILLCKGKDEEVVEYALSRNISPALIADYETKLLQKEVLREKLHELFEGLDNKI